MNILMSVLLVLFVIVSVLLIFLISIQDEKQSGLSGVFGGRGGSTFGSQTSSVVVKITTFLSVLFFVLALSLAVLHKISSQSDSLLKKEIQMVENPNNSVLDSTDATTTSEDDAKEASITPSNVDIIPIVNSTGASDSNIESDSAKDDKEDAIKSTQETPTNSISPVVE